MPVRMASCMKLPVIGINKNTSAGRPVLGTVLFFLASDLLGAYTEAWLLWYGLLFMLIVLFKPEGLAGLFHVRSKPAA